MKPFYSLILTRDDIDDIYDGLYQILCQLSDWSDRDIKRSDELNDLIDRIAISVLEQDNI